MAETMGREDVDEAWLNRAAELEMRRRDVAAAAEALRTVDGAADRERPSPVSTSGSAVENAGPAGDSMFTCEQAAESAVARARARLASAEMELELLARSAGNWTSEPVEQRIEELMDIAEGIAGLHERAIARARSARDVYLEALAEVFRAPAAIEHAGAEARSLAALYGLQPPALPPAVEISSSLHEELVRPPLRKTAEHAGSSMGGAAPTLGRAAEVLAGDARSSSVAARVRAIAIIRDAVTAESRVHVEALEASIREADSRSEDSVAETVG